MNYERGCAKYVALDLCVRTWKGINNILRRRTSLVLCLLRKIEKWRGREHGEIDRECRAKEIAKRWKNRGVKTVN